MTLIGDSIAAGLAYQRAATRSLARGIELTLDVQVCRRLVETSCPYRGTRPPTALDTILSAKRTLGRVVVVDVGYNDEAVEYAAHLDSVMRALREAGVAAVVWVTLRGERATYRSINREIAAAAARWPELIVADWDAASRGKAWFAADGLHLNSVGVMGLARFLRPAVLEACGDPCFPRHAA